MRNALVLALLTTLVAPACKKKEEAPDKPAKPTGSAGDAPDGAAADAAFTRRAETFYQWHLETNPGEASSLGYHEYDGALGDISPDAIKAELAALKKALADFDAISGLSKEREYERQILLGHIRGSIFSIEVRRSAFRNPMGYPWALNMTRYISRDYAPIKQRAEAIIKTCTGAPAFFEQARKNLEPRLPRTMVDTALLQANGTISFLKTDVIAAMSSLEATDKAALEKGIEPCVTAMTGYRDFLEGRKKEATDEFAIGADAFRRMLADSEGLDITLERLEEIGKADLERNLASLKAAAAKIAPGKSVTDAVAVVAADKPATDKVLDEATGQSERMKAFLIKNKIVSIPFEDKAEVRASPPFMRWNFAFLDGPGVFEKKSLPSFYYISPPDPSWSAKTQREYIASKSDLLFVTIHEVWPGHFLHFLHAKKSTSKIARSFCTYSMSEGWAHYTEEMMWDAGVGDGDPKVHVGQLQNALLRNVRFISAIGLHTQGMTVDESRKMFLDKGMQDEGNARQQAVRGTFDPGYLNYTLGKLMIRKLHADWKTMKGDAYTIAGFHDEFLRYQCAPVPVIRKLLLGASAGPAL